MPTLATGYYVEHFRDLVAFVADRYRHILQAAECNFLDRCAALSPDAEMLLIRMLMRKAQVFKQVNLNYTEISDRKAAIDELVQRGLVKDCGWTGEETQDLWTKADWWSVYALRTDLNRPAQSAKRDEWVTWWLALPSAECAQLIDRIPLVGLLGATTASFDVIKLLYFGNMRQDLSDYVLRDLGVQSYVPIEINNDTLLFQSWPQVEAHLAYYRCYDQYEDCDATDAIAVEHCIEPLSSLDDHVVTDSVLRRRVDRLRNKVARQLERLGEVDVACRLYDCTWRPPARERRTRIEAAVGDPSIALADCRAIAADPRDATESHFARSFGQRLAKKIGGDWPNELTLHRYTPPRIDLVLPQQQVEVAVAEHFGALGQCFWVENALVSCVFGLTIWDALVKPVPGAYFHPFQHGPMDLYEPEFLATRAAEIDQAIRSISTDDWPSLLRRRYDEHAGQMMSFVSYAVPWDLIALAIERIPRAHWLAKLQHFLTDMRHLRTGMPDLIFFPDDDKATYQWIEVKGPGDQLQQHQRAWLKTFAKHDIPHCVAYVKWQDTQ